MDEKLKIKSNLSLKVLLIIITISIAPFMESNFGVNYLLISYGTFFVLVNSRYIIKYTRDKKYLIPFLVFFIISIFANFDKVRVNSLLYTCFFLAIIYIYILMINQGMLRIKSYITILKVLIISFSCVLFIQQIMYFLNFNPVFNQLGVEGWRLNALSQEPSIAGITVNILFLSYIKMKEIISNSKYSFSDLIRKESNIIFFYLHVVLTCGSSFGLLFFIVVLFYFVKKENLIRGAIFSFLLVILLFFLNVTSIVRLFKFIQVALSFDYDLMIETDMSAAVRLIPVYKYIREFSFSDIHFWLGQGMGSSMDQISTFFDYENNELPGWFFPSFLIDHGILCFILFMRYLKRILFFSFCIIEVLLFILLMTNSELNTKILWNIILLFATNKYFLNLTKKTNI